MRFGNIFLVLLLVFVTACSEEKEYQNLGIKGDEPLLDKYAVKSPILSEAGQSLVTLNRFGFDITESATSWVAEEFLNLCDENPGKYFLEVGAGYGLISHRALLNGAKIISNDISFDQLVIGRTRIKRHDPELLKNLYLNSGHFPDIYMPENSLQGILMHRVAHFLSGEEIERGLDNMKMWLKPGGKVYFTILSPTHAAFGEDAVPNYNKRKASGDKWPGMWVHTKENLSKIAYAMPEKVHVMDIELLERKFKEAGFEVEKAGFVSMKKYGSDISKDHGNTIGIIASLLS